MVGRVSSRISLYPIRTRFLDDCSDQRPAETKAARLGCDLGPLHLTAPPANLSFGTQSAGRRWAAAPVDEAPLNSAHPRLHGAQGVPPAGAW
jgi:hypothetical protein